MVTCVDVCGMNVMTASLDGSIALWDLRVSNEHNTITTIRAAGNESVSQLCSRRTASPGTTPDML